MRITAYEEGGKFIGHRVLPVIGLCPGYRHVTLRTEVGQPITMATLFLCIVVKVIGRRNLPKPLLKSIHCRITFRMVCLTLPKLWPILLNTKVNWRNVQNNWLYLWKRLRHLKRMEPVLVS